MLESLVRGPDKRFKDDDLARIIHDATEWTAGAFQARGTPEVLRVIEILGIEQGRSWGACTVRILVLVFMPHLLIARQLNEFRKFMGLRRKLRFCLERAID